MSHMSWPEGRTVVEVRRAEEEEVIEEGWDDSPYPLTVVIFDDGSKIYASADEEGNGPGALFGRTAGGEGVLVCR